MFSIHLRHSGNLTKSKNEPLEKLSDLKRWETQITKSPNHNITNVWAGNETRTRDPDLGKVVLYQLSYSRLSALLSPKGTAKLKPIVKSANQVNGTEMPVNSPTSGNNPPFVWGDISCFRRNKRHSSLPASASEGSCSSGIHRNTGRNPMPSLLPCWTRKRDRWLQNEEWCFHYRRFPCFNTIWSSPLVWSSHLHRTPSCRYKLHDDPVLHLESGAGDKRYTIHRFL